MKLKKQTYLDSPEEYIRYRANLERAAFLEKNPLANQYGNGDVLESKMLELFKTNKTFKNKILSDLENEKNKVRKRHLKSIQNARDLGDASKNNYQRAKTIGKKGLSNISKKGHETLGVEGRKARAVKASETLGVEGRKARAAKAHENLGAEGRSKRAANRIATLKKEGRLGEVIKKSVKTIKEKYGDDHYSKQAKEFAVPVRVASVKKRVTKDIKDVLSKLPKYFSGQQLARVIVDLKKKPGIKASMQNYKMVNFMIKQTQFKNHPINIHENLQYTVENTIEDVISSTIYSITDGKDLKKEYYENEILSKIKETGWVTRASLIEKYTFKKRRNSSKSISYKMLAIILDDLVELGYMETKKISRSKGYRKIELKS